MNIDMYYNLTEFTQPWKHYIIDDFLNADFLKFLVSLRNHSSFELVDTAINNYSIVPKFIEGYPTKKSLKIFNDPQIKLQINDIVKNKLSNIIPSYLNVIPDLIRCDPGYHYPTHKDHKDKLFTIVVYLYPVFCDATILLGKNNTINIPWKINRALIFEQTSHGYHYYKNSTGVTRLTLNIYVTLQNNLFFYSM